MQKIRWWGLLLAAAILFQTAAGFADAITIQPDMELVLSEDVIKGIVKSNPDLEGLSPLTGLPTEEAYTPIAVVLDDSPEVFPHWGVADADWIVQTPLRMDGATRMMAVYGGAYPEQAGGVRSGRMTTFPVAVMFKAAAAFAGNPPTHGWDITVDYWIDEWDYNKPIRYFNLLSGKYAERVDFLEPPQNLSAHIQEMHQRLLERKVKFEQRAFLFTDEKETRGDEAKAIQMHFLSREEETLGTENLNSACSFEYQEGTGYLHSSRTGLYTDRDTKEAVPFANVVVLRCPVEWEGGYPYYKDHLRYYGQAEYFMNGRHFTGAWYRAGRLARLVLLDDQGQEISLQRGKTFLAINDENLVVSYE